MMTTVMNPPAQTVTAGQVTLMPITVHIIQQNQSGAIAEVGVGCFGDRFPAPYLLTHDCRVFHAPIIIADGSPVSLIVDLHPALALVRTPRQTYGTISYTTGMTLNMTYIF